MDSGLYVSLAFSILDDDSTYRKLKADPTFKVSWKKLLDKGLGVCFYFFIFFYPKGGYLPQC